MDRLSEFQVFLAIVEGGSLAAAARRLRRSPPAVTRILSGLEGRLGVPLIERSSRRCQPTEAGRRLADQARHVLASYDEAVGGAVDAATSPRGPLRVTAPLMFGREHVAPAVVDFLDLHPLVDVELQLADRVVDLHEEHFDLAVRIGQVTDPSLVARRVGTVGRVTVASPAYLAEHGTPLRPSDIKAHDVVQHSSGGPRIPWIYAEGGARVSVEVAPRYTVNQADAAIAAAQAGRGLVTALSYQVRADILDGRLVRVLAAFEPPPLPVSLVYPEARRSVRRLRLLVDHLAERLGRLTYAAPD